MSLRWSNDDNAPLIPSPQKKIHQAQLTLAPRDTNAPSPEVSLLSAVLLDELIVEILLRVPVKYLLQFRCVCKSWKCLISDPQFVKEHFLRSTMDTSFTNHRLAMCAKFGGVGDGFITCSLQSLFRNPSTCVDGHHEMRSRCRVVGSCNGLLCLYDYFNGRVCLWNPSNRWISENSPYLGDDWREIFFYSVYFGFGYDHITHNYKVVAVLRKHSPNSEEVLQTLVVKVYTLGAKSWRQIQNFPCVPQHQNCGSGKLVSGSGTLNWLAIRSDASEFPLVVSFDLGKETFKEVLLPDSWKNDSSSLDYTSNIGVLRDYLCFSYTFKGSDFVMWLMKEYGVKESWTKLVTIPISKFLSPVPLSMSENGEILVGIKHKEFLLYNPRDNTLNQRLLLRDSYVFHPTIYIESLISPSC